MAATDLRSVSSVEEVSQGLRDHAYLPDEALATAVYLALRLRRPLLLEGEPGVGKTEVAKVIAD
ncbi:MAG: MoxR family ATPase, partial [Acidimicrobiaceae bacterium]|nr:MoxR family ATPase [Acidimicrobiaceae bacterium]